MEKGKKTARQLCSDPSFVRWVEGEASTKEAACWDSWVQKNETNRRLTMVAMKKIYGFAFKEQKVSDVQNEWDKVRHKITQKEQPWGGVINLNSERSWDAVSILAKVAAVLIVGAFIGFIAYMYQENIHEKEEIAIHTLKTDFGEKKTINLSDGSQIILAANSQLSYKEGWLDYPTKRLSLEGEALFAVAPKKAEAIPKLVVKTQDGTASVWGTRFTVDTYGAGTRVVLEEGEIRLKAKNNNDTLTMSPGEMATFSGSRKKILLEKVNSRIYTSWFSDELFFDNTPLSVLVDRIEQSYGIEVEVRDPNVLQRKLSGSVDFKSLAGLTKAVEQVFDIQIQRSGESLIIDNNTNN